MLVKKANNYGIVFDTAWVFIAINLTVYQEFPISCLIPSVTAELIAAVSSFLHIETGVRCISWDSVNNCT